MSEVAQPRVGMRRWRRHAAFSFVAILAVATAAACSSSGNGASVGGATSLTVRLNYLPWSMHNYLYAAQDQGYFKAEHLNVNILPGQAGQSIQLVGAGREDIGITDATSFLSAVAQGAPIVAIAMDWPYSPGAIYFEKSSGITTPQSLVGKKVCYDAGSNVHNAILAGLKKVGVHGVNFVTVASNSEIPLILSGKCNAGEGFAIGQPQQLDMEGHPAGTITMRDLGLSLYGNVIFTTRHDLQTKKAALIGFMQAAAKGQMWAYKHIRKATVSTLKFDKAEPLNPDIVDVEAIYQLEYRDNPQFKQRWGHQEASTWQQTISTLKSLGTLTKPIQPTSIFTNQIVDGAPATAQFAQLFHSTKWAGA